MALQSILGIGYLAFFGEMENEIKVNFKCIESGIKIYHELRRKSKERMCGTVRLKKKSCLNLSTYKSITHN